MPRLAHEQKLVMEINPKSRISESFRTLRTNIRFARWENPVRTLLITSAVPGEGKTTTAANLAVSYAHEGKKVLLVDADLRKPSLHLMFGQTNLYGLTNLLTNERPDQEAIRESYIPNLSLVPSGTIPPNPAEILSSSRLDSLLEEWKRQFDIVIFDSPPTLAITDGLVVATRCDGVILVVQAGKVKLEQVRKAKMNLELVKSTVLGVVLNNVRRSKAAQASLQYYETD
ncbi:CpsD/CapB family tyrosine-protein kinase [Paenibacillus sp. MSJ-34]|uniref:CpsD/CapB family tyrosine-protein kinase n=1 Tax=Paenibacillus sp. MSJ-34 TaxID=2841529 RepID=UPI001C103ABB|nr:CpsD/CapB family tyrosine-protein kinase [Paenibacillus sp. MSJ-34]MBU5443476.1 CpsD/CapB family tyrosine-protein kinase [Paenibacillus sp. MSJ-34]